MIIDGRILIEAAVESVAAARAAERAGATRVELCGDLDVGGVTPEPSLVAATLAEIAVPVHVMVRVRPGNFVYEKSEVDCMCRAAAEAREAGAAGIVTGALRRDGSVDVAALERIAAAAAPLPMVFHRAFDETPRPQESLGLLIDLGIGGVLTSGAAPTAVEGIPSLRDLVRVAGRRIEVIAGGGVSGTDVAHIVAETGVRAVHARCETDGRRIAGITAALAAAI